MPGVVRPDDLDYDNGRPKQRGQRLDGSMLGAWVFYRRDGSLMRSGEFDRGRQVGVWRTYHRSGDIVSEKRFPNPEN